jgi:hypothetical protein
VVLRKHRRVLMAPSRFVHCASWGFVILMTVPLVVARRTVAGDTRPKTAPSATSATAEWPLSRAGFTFPEVFLDAEKAHYFEAAPGVPLSRLVHLSAFGAFRPGMTLDETAAQMGPPLRTRSDQGTRYALYELESSNVEVADDPSGSACVTYHRVSLYAYPRPDQGCEWPVGTVFDRSVAVLVPDAKRVEVAVSETGGGQKVWGLLREGCVIALNWWVPPMR